MTRWGNSVAELTSFHPSGIETLLEQVDSWSRQDLKYELKKYKAIKDWAFKKAGINYGVGDTVRIKDGYRVTEKLSDGHANGWWPSRECLVPGALATVTEIDFNAAHNYWYADIVLDREWSVGTGKDPDRYWHGPADDTPKGMKPPSQFDIDKYPNGRKHTFSFSAGHLEKVTVASPSEDDICPECGQHV